jgi:hypothetical protein
MTLPAHAHGGALDLNPRRPIPMRRSLFIGPIGPIKSTTLGAILPPRLEGGRPCLRNMTRLAWRPLDL